ncbi:SPFH domain-containing protein [Arthrobacter sp. SA17]
MIELLIGGGVLVLLLIAGFMYYVMSIRFAKPNEAMLITGKSDPNPTEDMSEDQSRVVINNRAFVNPITERVSHISLSSRQVEVTIEAISNNGIQLRLAGVAQVKVGGDKASVRKAAQRFLDQQDAIDHYTQETLSGSLRSIVGTLSVDAIIKDRAQFAASVKEEAEHSMTNQGLVIDTFQIKSVEDSSGYLKNLGRPEAALVARNASIAEANSQREAAEAKALADQKTAEAEQKLALRRAELKQETDARQAEADAAGPSRRQSNSRQSSSRTSRWLHVRPSSAKRNWTSRSASPQTLPNTKLKRKQRRIFHAAHASPKPPRSRRLPNSKRAS